MWAAKEVRGQKLEEGRAIIYIRQMRWGEVEVEFYLRAFVGPESRELGKLVWSKSEMEKYPNPENLIVRPAGVGVLASCSGPACSVLQLPSPPPLPPLR